MRRALPWILLLVFAALGAIVLLEARTSVPTDVDLDRSEEPREEPRLRGTAPDATARASGRRAPSTDTTDEAAAKADLPAFTVEGATRFQRRLSAGTAFRRLLHALEEDEADAEAVGERVAELADTVLWHDTLHTLRQDGVTFSRREGLVLARPEDVSLLLRDLTEPRRDLDGIALHGLEEPEDPLGTNLRLRTWTRGGPLRPVAMRAAEDLIARLDGHAGAVSREGFDVLATPAMGAEVFPRRTLSWPFVPAGYYTEGDDLCVIGTQLDDAFLSLVLRHELVHAWQHRHLPGMRSRFLQEGLAEYLSRLEPGDYGLDVPPERIRNELAVLLHMLQRMEEVGVQWSTLEPARLLGLDPEAFYLLGHLGYLLGLATVAYVGGETLQTALRSSSENVLQAAIRDIEWDAFVAFLGERATGGDASRAIWVQDGRGGEAGRSWKRGRRYRGAGNVLRGLGVAVPSRLPDHHLGTLMERQRPFPRDDAERVRRALEGVLEGDDRVLFLTDATKSMEASLRAEDPLTADGEPLLPGVPEVDTRVAFATALLRSLTSKDAERSVETWCFAGTPVRCTWPRTLVDSKLTLQGIPDWVARAKGNGASVVVCLASEDVQRAEIRTAIAEASGRPAADVDDETVGQVLASLLADRFHELAVAPATVLVVDLADGDGDALALATAFAQRLGESANVAYWNPQRPLR